MDETKQTTESVPEVSPTPTETAPETKAPETEAPKKSRKERFIYGRAVVYGPYSEVVRDSDGKLKAFRFSKGGLTENAQPTVSYFNHDKNSLTGTTENKSIELIETDLGVHFKNRLPNTHEGRKTFKLVKDDFLTGVSFSPKIIEAESEGVKDGVEYINVKKYALHEISPTAKPAFKGTSVSIKEEIRTGRDDLVKSAQAELEKSRRLQVQSALQQKASSLRAKW